MLYRSYSIYETHYVRMRAEVHNLNLILSLLGIIYNSLYVVSLLPIINKVHYIILGLRYDFLYRVGVFLGIVSLQGHVVAKSSLGF